MPKCDNCEREIDVVECRIRDKHGIRYRNLCDDCIKEFLSDFTGKTQIDILSNPPKSTKESKPISTIEGIKMTTTPSFEGYRIVEYKDVIFEESITGIGLKTTFKGISDIFASLTGEEMYAVTERINELKKTLLNRLKADAAAQGANAIVGVDFESTMPESNSIMVSVNGTAVVIKKID